MNTLHSKHKRPIIHQRRDNRSQPRSYWAVRGWRAGRVDSKLISRDACILQDRTLMYNINRVSKQAHAFKYHLQVRNSYFCTNVWCTSSNRYWHITSTYEHYTCHDVICYDMTWYYMILYDTIRHDMVRYDMAWHGMAWHGMALYDTWHDILYAFAMAWHDMSWYDITCMCHTSVRARWWPSIWSQRATVGPRSSEDKGASEDLFGRLA